MQKLGFQLFNTESKRKQAATPHLRDRPNRRLSYPSILTSLFKTLVSSLVLLNLVAIAFGSVVTICLHMSWVKDQSHLKECCT